MAGVIISGDTSGSVTLQAPATAGTVTVTLPATSGTMLTTASSTGISGSAISSGTVAEAYGGTGTNTGYYGFKNRIINGAMVIDQRNAGAAVTVNSGTDTFAVDRFPAAASGGGVFTMQRSTTSATNFSNSLLATVTTADSSIAAGDYYGIQQKIEGFNTADFNSGTANAKTITLSFWVRSSIIGTYGLGLGNNANNRWYPASYAISSANTWEQKSITLTCDTSGTWDTTTGTGLWLWLDLGSGSTYQGTANAWTGSTKLTVTGATQWIATNGATFYITGVQLEKGSTATSFDYRPYGTEFQLCQRYYQTYGIGNGVGTNTQRCISAANNSGNLIGTWSFIQNMRAAPSVTVYGSGTTTGNLVVNYSASSQALAANTAVTFSSLSVNGWMFNMGSTITANITNWIDMGTATNAGAFTFSAEL